MAKGIVVFDVVDTLALLRESGELDDVKLRTVARAMAKERVFTSDDLALLGIDPAELASASISVGAGKPRQGKASRRPCGKHCQYAKSAECSCECQGANHGIFAR
jgi:hypothetical protein